MGQGKEQGTLPLMRTDARVVSVRDHVTRDPYAAVIARYEEPGRDNRANPAWQWAREGVL